MGTGHVGAVLCLDVLVTEQQHSRIYWEHNRSRLTARLITISRRAGILPPLPDISRLLCPPVEVQEARPDANPPHYQDGSFFYSLPILPSLAQVLR